MLTFAAPAWLLALPLPVLVWRVASWRQSGTHGNPATSGAPAALVHSQTELLTLLAARRTPGRSNIPWLWLAGCILLVLAVARPQWSTLNTTSEYQGRDFMLAIDVSGSMRALDFVIDGKQHDRLDMVKHIVNRFLDERNGDRVGLIVFADDAYSLAPVTTDKNLLKQILADVKNGMIGEKTALGNAVALAVKRLRGRRENARILLLLTDGTNTSGEITPESAIQLAKYYKVRIYTVGIGSSDRVAFPRGPLETPEFTELPLDEALLRHMADETGGKYYAAHSTEDMGRIIRNIEQLEKVTIVDERAFQKLELYWLPLLAGMLLLLISQLRSTRQVLPS